MSQNSNALKWVKVVALLGAPILFVAACLWLGGFIFLTASKIDSITASPFTLYEYYQHYGSDKKTNAWLTISLIASFALCCLPLLLLLPNKKKLFGDAKWATERDIRKAGLYSDDGIIVGQQRIFFGLIRRLLILSGSQHVLMSAPTRSMKGVSIVVPNLLSWKGSTIVIDVKQENWDMTAGFRAQHGQECFLLSFAPENLRSHRWNPLHYIRSDSVFRIDDIQKIGQMLFPRIETEAPIWQSSARSLWLGLVLYLLETEELPVTIGEAFRQLTMGDDRLLNKISERQAGDAPLSSECYLSLKDYLDTPEKTRGSVRKSFTSAFENFYSPLLDCVLSSNDFDLRDLRKKRMSIYLAVPAADLDRVSPLVNLFIQQAVDLNTRELPEQNPKLRHKVLFLADEFTALGKVGVLSKGISYIAGYGLRMLTVIQSPAQLRDVYGADAAENFAENHAMQIVFAPKNIKVAKEISESLGTSTVKNKSRSRQLSGKSGRSESVSDHGRSLLLPQEVRDIGQQAAILLLENCPPILCEKIVWYQDKIFSSRGNNLKTPNICLWPAPEVPKLDLNSNVKGEIEFSKNEDSPRSFVERPISAIDVDKLDELNLDDFSCDFSSIEIPKGEIDDETMDNIVNRFFQVVSV